MLSCLVDSGLLFIDFDSEVFRVSTNGASSLVELNPRANSFQREILSRRDAARRILGVTAAWSLGGLHPVWGHLLNETTLPGHADIDLASATWEPLFLSPQQNEGLQSISEAMIPGSTSALVNRFIDLLLSVESAARQQKFIVSLSALQAEGNRRFGNSFEKLSALQRDALLTSVSTSTENSANRESFEDLKEWIVASYYSSETGMKELGWTPNRFFPNFPGCTHPDGHI